MSERPVVQGLWVGGPLSLMEQLCMRSFLQHGHEFHLYAYDELENIPSGVELRDAGSIVDEQHIFRLPSGSYTGFANWFRYEMLAKNGGWWIDMDYVCLAPFEFDAEYVLTKCNSVIKVPPDSALMNSCAAAAGAAATTTTEFGQFGVTGFFDDQVIRHGLEDFLVPQEIFNPLRWEDWALLIDPESSWAIPEGCISIHLFQEMWRLNRSWRQDSRRRTIRNGIRRLGRPASVADRNRRYPESTLYGALQARYL